MIRTLLLGLWVALGPSAVPARAAGPVYWDYPAGVAFTEFDLAGAGLDEYGRLTPGLAATELPIAETGICWTAVEDGEGGVYVGSGHDGQVWRLGPDGASRCLATVDQPEVFALARVGDHLFAGGGPDGRIHRLSPDGAVERWAELPEGFVWALAPGPAGVLYAGVGSPAAVYRITARDATERLVELPAAHVLSLVVLADGRLLAGTQGPGLIYEIEPARPTAPHVLHEAAQDEVRQLVADDTGVWHALAVSRASLAPGPAGLDRTRAEPSDSLQSRSADLGDVSDGPILLGPLVGRSERPEPTALYRLEPDGLVVQSWGGDTPVRAVAFLPGRGWVGVGPLGDGEGRSALWSLATAGRPLPLATWPGGEITALIPWRGKGRPVGWLVTQGQPGRAFWLEERPAADAVALAPPIDGGRPLRWGRLRWEGEVPGGARLVWSVRGGPRMIPDETWSEWSDGWSDTDHSIPLSPSRFLQWRVTFAGENARAAVASVTVTGCEPNLPPRIRRFEVLAPGELTVEGRLSGMEGVTETFSDGLKIEYGVDSRRERKPSPQDAAVARGVRTFAWQADDPNGDRLMYTLHYQKPGDATWRTLGKGSVETLRGWDTREVPDGEYVVRLTASDAPDNLPDGALTASRLCAPLRVDNTPPRVTGLRLSRVDAGLAVVFSAEDAANALAEAWLELPDNERFRLDPEDGVCDSHREQFNASLRFPRAGKPAEPPPWRLRVGVIDRAGNVAFEEAEVR